MKIRNRAKGLLLTALLVLAAVLLAGCPAAPPTEPMDQYRPYVAPGAVKSLKVTNGYEDEITLSWDASPNASEYQIWMIEASDYGAAVSYANTDSNYTRLQERGFKLLSITEDTTFKLRNLPHNKAYVFSVLAMRGVGSEGDRKVLYSDIGSYAEGSTVGDIAFAAVSLSDEVIVSWQVNNFYSVLPTVPGTKEALFDDYEFSVEYRRADESSFTSVRMEPGDERMYFRMDYYDYGLQLDTDYIFRVSMSILDGTKVISRVESFEFPVHTSSDFTFAPVKSVTASRAAHKDSVDVTWVAPNVPSGVELENVFEIQRTVWSEDPAEIKWDTVLKADEFKDLAVPVPEDRTYTWTDTTVKANTRYLYRVLNGYMVGPSEAEMKPVMQDENTPVTETAEPAFSIWRPENISLTRFEKGDGENPLEGMISLAWAHEEVPAEGAKWELRTDAWNADTSETVTTNTEITPASVGSAFTFDHILKITEAESHHVTVYTFTLVYKYGDLTLELPVLGTNVSLGKSEKIPMFDGLAASTDFVGQIVLRWNVIGTLHEENSYSIWIDDASDWVAIDSAAIVGSDTSRTYTLSGVEGQHSYRLKLNGTPSDTVPAYDYVCPDTVIGNVLRAPAAPSVTDSTSRDSMTVTWTAPAEGITYILEYRAKGDTDWTPVAIDTASGVKELPAAEGFSAGTVYEFRMKAENSFQEVPTAPSAIEEGSIFGPASMDLKIVDNGLDPDKITLSWEPVTGATSYKIVRNGETLSGTVRGKNTYEDKGIISIVPSEAEPMPRSAEYEYEVIPYLSDEEHGQTVPGSAKVKGKLFAPPRNVTASKGTSTGVIDITWDAVDGAEYYIVKPYGYDTDGKPVSKGPAVDIKDGTRSYKFTAGDESLFFTVQAVRAAGTVKSQYQNGFMSSRNFLNDEEASNYGYKLRKPESFFVEEVIRADGFYAPYVTLKWQMVEGAETYMIRSSLHSEADGLALDVTSLTYDSENAVISNKKSPDEAGYLAYDREKKEYTYNDDSGYFRTSSKITSYSISAMDMDTSTITEDVRDNTIVHRMFKPVECVNLVNRALKPQISAADKAFGNDWWAAPNSNGYDGNNGFTVERYSETASGTWFNGKNLMKLDKMSFEGFEMSTTVPIQYFIDYTYDGWAGYLGTDPLIEIGTGGQGTIRAAKPSYIPFTVTYNKVEKAGKYTGKYDVVIGNDPVVTVSDSAEINRPF